MKKILITGSIAYDNLLTFDGFFKDYFSANIDKFSLSFLADTHESFFGGCACNIAYNLKFFGVDPVILGVAGNDFDRYKVWLEKNNISILNIYIDKDNPTASASILTDKDENQLAFFSPAAMKTSPIEIKINSTEDIKFAIISPELPERMIYFANYFIEIGIPYFFDIGQSITMLSKEQISFLIENSSGVFLNEYESTLLAEKLNISLESLVKTLEFVVVTLGEKGSRAYFQDNIIEVSGFKTAVVDPTGCGDAFRAGFIAGYLDNKPFEECLKMGNVAGSFALSAKGPQNHKFTFDDFLDRLGALKCSSQSPRTV